MIKHLTEAAIDELEASNDALSLVPEWLARDQGRLLAEVGYLRAGILASMQEVYSRDMCIFLDAVLNGTWIPEES